MSNHSSGSSKKKRDRLMFQTVDDLNQEDKIGLSKRFESSKKQKQNSLAAISQQSIHTKLLEVRILLQRALQAEHDYENNNDRDEAIQQCNDLLAKLLSARDSMLGENDNDDETTDYEALIEDDNALEKTLGQEYAAVEKDWQTVLNQRHKDVRLHAGLTSKSQFRVLDSSFWEQVEQAVTHEKLVAGTNKHDQGDNKVKHSTIASFDDAKVYQQHLKEFLSSATSSSNAQNNAQQSSSVERQSGSRRTVNHVDRRASKGRKLRYNPIPKLVNFTFPLSRPNNNTTSMLDEDAWFRSLFGGAGASKGT